MRLQILAALALATGCAMAGSVAAQNVGGEICYGPAQTGPQPVGNATLFACAQAGNKTVPQLAAAGWRIVKLTPVVGAGGATQPQLVIQRRDLLFRHGFQ